ncbi:MAG: VWA domain-containing protein, partial [Deltaproteobacteria bacterium]|nr:VWA domain-containing protein [Deltaproteobacteria bacterium]
MAKPINLMERYLLEQYDKTSQTGIGVEGAVDPHERAEFLKNDVGVDPAAFLKLLGSDPKDAKVSFVNSTFEGWRFKAIAKAPYLSDLQLEQFKAVLLGIDSTEAKANSSNGIVMNIGDDKASSQFNSKATVNAARIRDIPREGRAFMPLDPSKEVIFTIDLDSVNAYDRPKKEEENSSMLSFSRVYIVPKDYKGKVPPLPEEMAKWHENAKEAGFSGPVEGYFYEIIPGQTEAKSSKIFDNGRGDFSFTIKMPPGSYEVHGVSGEFKQKNNQADFDNFIIKVTGQNAVAQAEVLHVPIATTFEVEDAMQRRFIEQVTSTAEVQGEDGNVKGRKIDIIFAIDNSVSMEPGAALVRNTVADIIGALKRGGAEAVRVGVITFNNPGSIFTVMPLTAMDGKNLAKLYDAIGNIRFDGGIEPVCDAALKAISELEGTKDSSCQVMVVTDYDGIRTDNGVLYGEEVAKAASAAKVAVNLQVISFGYRGSTTQPVEQVVPAEYIALLNALPDPSDEAKIEKVRKLAFGEGIRNNTFKITARKALISVGTKDDIDRIGNTPKAIDSSMVKLLIDRGAAARDVLYKVAKGNVYEDNSAEAAKALIAIDGGEAAQRLGEIFQDEKTNLRIRGEIAYVLASNGNEPAARFLVSMTKSFPDNVDSKTLQLLISRGASSKDALVSVAMSKANISARMAAVGALAVIDKELAIKGAEAVFSSTPASSETIEFILSIDKEREIAFLKRVLQDTAFPHEDRIIISKSLAARGDEEAIDYLCAEAAVMTNPEDVLNLLISLGEKGLDAVRKLAMHAYACQTRLIAAKALMTADKDVAKAAVQDMVDNPEGREFFNRP